jgi:phytoene dehydrogenase-like protein
MPEVDVVVIGAGGGGLAAGARAPPAQAGASWPLTQRDGISGQRLDAATPATFDVGAFLLEMLDPLGRTFERSEVSHGRATDRPSGL